MSAILCNVAWLFSLAASWTVSERKIGSSASTLDFKVVYDEHFQFAWRSLRGLGVSTHDIDDAAQEVFLIVHRKLDTITEPNGIKSWIFSIVRRVASDYRRSRKRKGISVEYDDSITAIDTATPQNAVENREVLSLVEQYLDTLTDETRSMFVLSEIEQLPVSKISEILEMNSNTIYSRLRVTRKNMESFMARSNV